MDVSIPYLRAQNDLLSELNVKVRDGSNTRWSAVEKYTALNEVLLTWADHVKLPRVYTITDGWQANDYEYALPNYMRPPFYPELLRRIPHSDYVADSLTTRWQDVPGWEVVSDGSGGQTLRLHAPPYTTEGQVGWYAPNSRVPTTVPTSSGSTTASATTMTIGSVIDVDDVGYIKAGVNYISYAGVTRGASTTVLNNLVWGLYGSTATTVDSGTSVYWCVAMDEMSLLKLLFDQWRAVLHAYFIQDGGVHETGRHEKAMGYYDQMALNFWPTYKPRRHTQSLTLNRKVFALR